MSHAESHTDNHSLTPQAYVTGFILSLVLTLLAFGLVMFQGLTGVSLLVTVVVCAVLQIYVQLHYFLHLDGSSAQRWNVLSLIYTVIIIAFLVVGSLWIMYNTRILMMPGM